MSDVQRSLVTGANNAQSTTVILFTNNTGFDQAWLLWDLSWSVNIMQDTAISVSGTATLKVGSTVVDAVELFAYGPGSASVGFYSSLAGREVLLANGATVTLVTSGSSHFVAASVRLTYDQIQASV